MNKSCLEAAAEAAAKVNAMLIAKGKLKLPPSQVKPKINSSGRGLTGDLITAEIDINDAPITARNLLTRGHTQDEICKLSGAAVSTRGRYMTLEERQNISTPDCRPLYLHIQASTQESVGLAVKRIQEIINQHVIASGGVKMPTVGVVTYPTSNINTTNNSMMSINTHMPSGPHYVQDKVFVGLEHAPLTYPVREKILGPGGSFLQHIRTETGANVTLRGKGSGFIEPTSGREAFEPLYIHVTHPKLEGLQAAKALAINLVETAHVEFAQWQQQQQRPVISSITPIVIPQATQVAYQNQVVVTPAVVPGGTVSAIASTPSMVTATIPIPSSSVAGLSLPQTVSQLVQSPVTGVPPVSIVTSIPVSVQGIVSPAVISYPTTYVTNHNSAVGRMATPVAAPAVSGIIGVVPRQAVSTTLATSQQGTLSVAQYPTSVQAVALSSPLTYAAVPSTQAQLTQAVLQQPSVVVAQNPVSFSTVPQTYVSNQPATGPVAPAVSSWSVIQGVSTAYPHIHYTTGATVAAEPVKQQVQQFFKSNQVINKTEVPDSRQRYALTYEI